MNPVLAGHLRERAKAALLILFFGAVLAYFRAHPLSFPPNTYTSDIDIAVTDRRDRAPGISPQILRTISVTVSGEVAREGKIDVIEGTTLKGLFEIVRPNANAYIQHADYSYALQPGDDIHIPAAVSAKSGGRVVLSEDTLQRIRIRSNPKIAKLLSPEPIKPLININRATAEILQTLPRIGPEMAHRIIADRESRGPFRKKDDLLRVKGVGRKTFKWIEPLIEAE